MPPTITHMRYVKLTIGTVAALGSALFVFLGTARALMSTSGCRDLAASLRSFRHEVCGHPLQGDLITAVAAFGVWLVAMRVLRSATSRSLAVRRQLRLAAR